ncbi:MAG: flavodoxin-dependent (E)-4-hydroxy-3-methylbut-2-enyl-diphosphate synthase [Clostridia bacterium]|nr:flavodoxin-dependent (E)-4-hydroxy-3-methylbut-2-enyl-diphosphate synthase [Clostridia bacterium]
MFTNKTTKKIKVGNIFIGGGSKISIQSMLNVPAENTEENVKQALELQNAGCEIIRVSVPNKESLKTIEALKNNLSVPIVADIHFDWRLAVESVYAGADKVRINPGNIGDDSNVKQVAKVCKEHSVPIRIGVNSGSLEKDILSKYGTVTPEAIVESGFYHIGLLEKFDFTDIVLSLKSSNTQKMFDAYKLASKTCPYPLHLGVTEAGTKEMGIIKSSAGIGGLLLSGIGDTIRISLTDNPIEEVIAAKHLLKGLDLRENGIKFVSCPTCGRTSIDLIKIAKEAEKLLSDVDKNITVAIMGCVVNGPGEAKDADIGIAGGKGSGVLFKKGKILYNNISEDKLLKTLVDEIKKM